MERTPKGAPAWPGTSKQRAQLVLVAGPVARTLLEPLLRRAEVLAVEKHSSLGALWTELSAAAVANAPMILFEGDSEALRALALRNASKTVCVVATAPSITRWIQAWLGGTGDARFAIDVPSATAVDVDGAGIALRTLNVPLFE